MVHLGSVRRPERGDGPGAPLTLLPARPLPATVAPGVTAVVGIDDKPWPVLGGAAPGTVPGRDEYLRRVADIADHQFAADVVWPAVVHGGGERIEPADVMARGPHGLRDVRPDEPGRAGHENAHASAKHAMTSGWPARR